MYTAVLMAEALHIPHAFGLIYEGAIGQAQDGRHLFVTPDGEIQVLYEAGGVPYSMYILYSYYGMEAWKVRKGCALLEGCAVRYHKEEEVCDVVGTGTV